jgi:CDP-diacylglycerol--glycerol-3-phosphate 3-phosphatidyltransferase
MIIGPLDALDGVLARIQKRDGKSGAFFDSVSDRYSEIFLYGGLLIYFIRFRPDQNLLLVFLAVTGSVMVSYTRARAESLNFSAKIGLLSRAERYLILIPGLIFGYPQISLWILALLTHFTALQRIWFVQRQAKLIEKQENNKGS